jgi:hypothetical protein
MSEYAMINADETLKSDKDLASILTDQQIASMSLADINNLLIRITQIHNIDLNHLRNIEYHHRPLFAVAYDVACEKTPPSSPAQSRPPAIARTLARCPTSSTRGHSVRLSIHTIEGIGFIPPPPMLIRNGFKVMLDDIGLNPSRHATFETIPIIYDMVDAANSILELNK